MTVTLSERYAVRLLFKTSASLADNGLDEAEEMADVSANLVSSTGDRSRTLVAFDDRVVMAKSLLSQHTAPEADELPASGLSAVPAQPTAPGAAAQPPARGGASSPAPQRSRFGLRRRTRTVTLPEISTPVHAGPQFEIAPNDPILGYCQSAEGPVDITDLELDSPGLAAMRAAGVVLVVPLVSSGELIGLLHLGPRLSERDYSTDDRHLLDSLAGHAAPAIRVGQLVLEQQAEARQRERIDQELKVAQLIQQQFLPKELPDLPSWSVAAFYRPARQVGGDFYDFIALRDGRVMVVVGDVTDKGVPAALVMASTHALLRSTAPDLTSPGAVLAHVNDLLCHDIPAHMFVTCLAILLDPRSGTIEYANAGHDLPFLRGADGVVELKARGMPLGLMPGSEYEQKTTELGPGDCLLLHSDGLAEAHSPTREMFGFPRIGEVVARGASGEALIDMCLSELDRFTGPDHEQEDDITLVSLQRSSSAHQYDHGGRR